MVGVCRPALVLSVALCALVSARQTNPQNPTDPRNLQNPQVPVFRSGVDVVRVDVYPRTRDRVVQGLTREDFQLTEDGVRQTIETFEYIAIDMDRGVEPLDPRSLSEARRMAEDPRNRVFVFYLDTYEITMEGSARAREPLLAFLQGSMGPRDLFAWMTPKQSPEFLEFTRATQDLATLMTFVRPWGQKDTQVDDPDELKLQGCAPPPSNGPPFGPNALVKLKREIEMQMDLKELIIRLGALRQERKNLVILGERWLDTLGDPFIRRRAPLPVTATVRTPQRGPGSFVPKSPTMDAWAYCDQMRQYLGRQQVFDRAQALIDLARRNNVALYFVSLAPKMLANFSVARSFAEDTDGQSFVSNDIGASLDRVLAHQTGFYMLGYRSTAGESGAKPRMVRVKTTRSGVDLDVRRIYDPPPAEFVAARNTPRAPVVRTEVEKAIDRLPPVREDAELAIQAVARPAVVEVTIEVASRLAAVAPWTSGGRVTIALRDEAGGVLATGDGTFAAGARSARVLVPVAEPVKVTRVSAQVVHAGGATLGDAAVVDAAPSGVFGTAVFGRAGSLPRLPFLPAALLSFGRTERVRVEWPLVGALENPSVRILNASGAALSADLVMTNVEGPTPMLRADLRLLSMAPGEYVIEAAGTTGGTPVRIMTAIRVTR